MKTSKNPQTRVWLEESAKAKELHYQERIKSVHDTTQAYKHLLLFPKTPTSLSPEKPRLSMPEINGEDGSESTSPVGAKRDPKRSLSIEQLNYPQATLLGKNLKKKLELCTIDLTPTGSVPSPEKRECLGIWAKIAKSKNKLRSKTKLNNNKEDLKKPSQPQSVGKLKLTATTPKPRLSFLASPRTPGTESARLYNTKSLAEVLTLAAEERETERMKSHQNFIRSSIASLTDKFMEKSLNSERTRARTRLRLSQGSLSSGLLEDSQPLLSQRQSYPTTLEQLDQEATKSGGFRSEREAGGSMCQIMSMTARENSHIKGRQPSIYDKEVKDILERGINYSSVNWGHQRQKVKNMLEDKIEKGYRRNFCVIEERFPSSTEGGQRYKLFVDQIEEEDELDLQLDSKKFKSVPVKSTIPHHHHHSSRGKFLIEKLLGAGAGKI